MLCCVVGRRKQYGGHHESNLRWCRAVVQRSWYDSSPVKFLEVSLVRVWPRRLVKAMFSLNCFAIRKVLLISGPLPSRVSDHDVVSPSLLQCAFCGHYRHISCIFKTFVRSRWCWLMVICPAETEFVARTTDLCPPNTERSQTTIYNNLKLTFNCLGVKKIQIHELKKDEISEYFNN